MVVIKAGQFTFSSGQPLLLFSARMDAGQIKKAMPLARLLGEIKDEQEAITYDIGQKALTTIQKWLSPGNRSRQLGFTGRAADSLSLTMDTDQDGWSVAGISESGAAPWLPYIRQGWPSGNKIKEGGINHLIDWVKHRKLRWKMRKYPNGKRRPPPKSQANRKKEMAYRVAYQVQNGQASQWMASGRFGKAGKQKFFDFYRYYNEEVSEQHWKRARTAAYGVLQNQIQFAISHIMAYSFSEILQKATARRNPANVGKL
jgi:hypothetical protein